MTSHLLLTQNKDVVYLKDTRWWAERGLIHWENTTTGDYGSQSVRATLERMRGISDMVRTFRETGDEALYPGDLDRDMRYVEQMVDLCTKARAQHSAKADTVARARRRRGKRGVTMPANRPMTF